MWTQRIPGALSKVNDVQLVRAIVTAYLIITLSATALAKLKNWRIASAGVTRENVIPARAASAVILAVSAAELLLATFFMLDFQPKLCGLTAMGLFLAFLGYQLLVAARTNSLMCACAGVTRTDPASLPGVTGTAVSCLIQAVLSFVLALTGAATGVFRLLAIIAWIIPIILFAAGFFRRHRQPEASHQIPVWSPYRNYDIGELDDQSRDTGRRFLR
jgi:hypothetical protein